jgi:peroxiredoxin
MSHTHDAIPGSPREIRPLMIGDIVPAVTVASVDGAPMGLTEVISGKPTILIFYRGGW